MSSPLVNDIDFLYELGTLRNIDRGWSQLCPIKFQNLTEHAFRTIWISLIIALNTKDSIDLSKILLTSMSYNIPKIRTGDYHYVSAKNATVKTEDAFNDILKGTSFNDEFKPILDDYYKKKNYVALLVDSSNALENRFELEELSYLGIEIADIWAYENDLNILPKISDDLVKKYWKSLINSDPNQWHLKAKNVLDFNKQRINKKGASKINKDIDLLYELGCVKNLDRTWVQFVGRKFENVAEHTFRTLFISYLIALYEKLDIEKVLIMSLLHDIQEIRSGDANYIIKMYSDRDSRSAIKETFNGTSINDVILNYWEEYNEQKTPESKATNDADHLEPMLELFEQKALGMDAAQKWWEVNRSSLLEKMSFDYSMEFLIGLENSKPNHWHYKVAHI